MNYEMFVSLWGCFWILAHLSLLVGSSFKHFDWLSVFTSFWTGFYWGHSTLHTIPDEDEGWNWREKERKADTKAECLKPKKKADHQTERKERKKRFFSLPLISCSTTLSTSPSPISFSFSLFHFLFKYRLFNFTEREEKAKISSSWQRKIYCFALLLLNKLIASRRGFAGVITDVGQ